MKQLTSSCDQRLVVMRETEAGCLTPLGVGTEMLYGGPAPGWEEADDGVRGRRDEGGAVLTYIRPSTLPELNTAIYHGSCDHLQNVQTENMKELGSNKL